LVKRLVLLNGLAILAVILYHSSAWGFIAMFWWTDRYLPVSVPNFDQLGGLTYYVLRGIEQFATFGIQAFLFVSGFFVASATGKSQPTIRWAIVFSRIKTLAIPFLLWSVLFVLVKLVQGESYTTPKIIYTVLVGQVEPPFYYVPMLIQLYLLAPFLVPFARKRWVALLIITGLIQIFTVGMRYPKIFDLPYSNLGWVQVITFNWLFLSYMFFFCLGIVFGFHLAAFKQWISRYRYFLLSGAVVLFAIGMAEWEYLLKSSGADWIAPAETLLDQAYAFAFIFSFLAFEQFIPPLADQLAYIGTRSFGIYLIHSPVLEFTARVIYHLVPGLLLYQILFQPALWAAGLGVPLLMMYLVNRSPLRRFYSYLFG